MSPGGGVCLLSGRSRVRLCLFAVVDTVGYEVGVAPVQWPNMRGCGGGKLGDEAPVTRWGGGGRLSVFRIKLL